jgi:tight adherence protein B
MIISRDIVMIIAPAGLLLSLMLGYYFLSDGKNKKRQARIERVTKRNFTKAAKSPSDAMTLRRKQQDSGLPFLRSLVKHLPNMDVLRARMIRAGMTMSADRYLAICLGIFLVFPIVFLVIHKPLPFGVGLGFVFGVILPHKVVSFKGNSRIKKFLLLFPEAIEYIVRGLRSGLPVTESMNMVGEEMAEPIGSIFASIGESVKLGITVEKALQDTARKLNSTEFNFFVTSIILQRETGGNLSEILNNLADVLRKRFMMRMKIKAMSSEAKASAYIIAALPFVVITALAFISPDYMVPLIDDHTGNLAAAGAACSLTFGFGIMMKMTRFEI